MFDFKHRVSEIFCIILWNLKIYINIYIYLNDNSVIVTDCHANIYVQNILVILGFILHFSVFE